jgi:hypothetical protein
MGAGASFESGFDKSAFAEAVGPFYTSALFRKLSVNDKVPLNTLLQYANDCNDIFLTHDWGLDEDGRNNHARVSLINTALKARGLKTWFDEDRMEGKLKQKMLDGIDSSAVVITFVTDRYMAKIAGKGDAGDKDNCMFEYEHATRTKGAGKIVVIVNEKRCQQANEWYGALAEVAGNLHYNFISDDQLENVADQIYDRVISIMNGCNVTTLLKNLGINEVTSSRIVVPANTEKISSSMTSSVSTPILSDGAKATNLLAKWLPTVEEIVPSRITQYAKTLVTEGVSSVKRIGASSTISVPANTEKILSDMASSGSDTETVNVLAKWLSTVDIVPSRIQQYAKTLVTEGVSSVKRLGKTLSKVQDCSPQVSLVSKFHIDKDDADEIVDALINAKLLNANTEEKNDKKKKEEEEEEEEPTSFPCIKAVATPEKIPTKVETSAAPAPAVAPVAADSTEKEAYPIVTDSII